MPAYLRDLFGIYQVGAIHGRLLTAWSTAGVLGPLIVNRILDTQGTPGELVAADYRPALFTMVGVLVVGFTAKPAHPAGCRSLAREDPGRGRRRRRTSPERRRSGGTDDIAIEPEDIPIVEEEHLTIVDGTRPQDGHPRPADRPS